MKKNQHIQNKLRYVDVECFKPPSKNHHGRINKSLHLPKNGLPSSFRLTSKVCWSGLWSLISLAAQATAAERLTWKPHGAPSGKGLIPIAFLAALNTIFLMTFISFLVRRIGVSIVLNRLKMTTFPNCLSSQQAVNFHMSANTAWLIITATEVVGPSAITLAFKGPLSSTMLWVHQVWYRPFSVPSKFKIFTVIWNPVASLLIQPPLHQEPGQTRVDRGQSPA